MCSCVVFLQQVWSKITTVKRKVLHCNFLRSNFFRAVDPLWALQCYKYTTMRISEIRKDPSELSTNPSAVYQRQRLQQQKLAYQTSDEPVFKEVIARVNLPNSLQLWAPLLSKHELTALEQYANGKSLTDIHNNLGITDNNRSAKALIRSALTKIVGVYNYFKNNTSNDVVERLQRSPSTKHYMQDLAVLNKYKNLDIPW